MQQNEVVMLQGSFSAEHARGLILNMIKEKMDFKITSINRRDTGKKYIQYIEDRQITVMEELQKALEKIGDKRVNLNAIILVEPEYGITE